MLIGGEIMSKGKFIAFEGLDGSGKTTQARRLRDRINDYLIHNNSSIVCELQEEPYHGDVIGGVIRSVLSGQTIMPEDSLAYLYVSNRLTHISTMLPKLATGNHIICDRYYFSNFAYNQTNNVSLEDIIALNKLCIQQLQPEVTFYLYVSPEIAEKRRGINRRSVELNDSREKQLQVYNNFEFIMDKFSDNNYELHHNICKIDCDHLTEDMVADAIWDYLTTNIFPNRIFF